jgi:hypothetical protein
MTGIAAASTSRVSFAAPLNVNGEGQAQCVALQLAALMLALLIPTALGVLFDARLTNDSNGWIKPMKFEVSFAIHFATLALLIGLMAPAARDGRLIRWSVQTAAVLAVLEVAYIMAQAGRARASHFNNATRLEEVAYALMGLGALTIVIVTFVVGLMLWHYARPGITPAMRFAASIGLMFSGLATLVVAGYMSQTGAHGVGGVSGDAGSLPIVGWLTRGGDLRVAHFFATHAAQTGPLFALAWGRLKPNSAVLPVVVFIALYAVITVAVFVQALMGLPFFPLR